jgi:MSHA pilin protein MshC
MFLLPYRPGAGNAGFTLVELIVVIILVSVLAVVAIPRLRGVDSFNTMGFTDRVMAGLRYAQKQAVAKRRNVCVAFTATTVSFTFASAAGSGSACNTALTGPAGQAAFSISPESSSVVTLAPVPAGLTFDALGRPVATATGLPLAAALVITIMGDAARSFSVEPETGYVHT